jgi:hypothetical protein
MYELVLHATASSYYYHSTFYLMFRKRTEESKVCVLWIFPIKMKMRKSFIVKLTFSNYKIQRIFSLFSFSHQWCFFGDPNLNTFAASKSIHRKIYLIFHLDEMQIKKSSAREQNPFLLLLLFPAYQDPCTGDGIFPSQKISDIAGKKNKIISLPSIATRRNYR